MQLETHDLTSISIAFAATPKNHKEKNNETLLSKNNRLETMLSNKRYAFHPRKRQPHVRIGRHLYQVCIFKKVGNL